MKLDFDKGKAKNKAGREVRMWGRLSPGTKEGFPR